MVSIDRCSSQIPNLDEVQASELGQACQYFARDNHFPPHPQGEEDGYLEISARAKACQQLSKVIKYHYTSVDSPLFHDSVLPDSVPT